MFKIFSHFVLGSILFVTICSVAYASSDDMDVNKYSEMSLDELMQVKVTVASGRATALSRAPAAVTLITSEDIARMGARDLVDVLRMVPGFTAYNEGQGVVSMVTRAAGGSYVLVLVDEIPINDELYSTQGLGNRLPLDMIDRIEILRGPGSIRYGGRAGVAVVKISTKNTPEAKSQGSLAFGVQEYGSQERKAEGLVVKSGDQKSGGILFSVRDGNQSEQSWTDGSGIGANLKDNSRRNDVYTNSKINIGNFSALLMTDNYKVLDQTAYGDYNPPLESFYDVVAGRLSYELKLSDKLKITPTLTHKYDNSWRAKGAGAVAAGLEFARPAWRYDARIELDYRPDAATSYNLGVIASRIKSENQVSGSFFARNQSQSAELEENAIYGEVFKSYSMLDLTLGGRYDHGPYGDAFVPRVSAVAGRDNVVYKVNYSEGYRLPTIENFYDNAPGKVVNPSTVRLYEFEISKNITDKSVLSVNLFRQQIDDPIAFFFQVTPSNPSGTNYRNVDGRIESGIDLTYLARTNRHSFTATYNYLNNLGSVPAPFGVTGHPGKIFMFPDWKLTLIDSFKMNDLYTVSPSLVYEGPAYTSEYSAALGGTHDVRSGERLSGNLNVERKNIFNKQTSLSFSIFNVGNVSGQYDEIAGGLPLPSQSRTYMLKINSIF